MQGINPVESKGKLIFGLLLTRYNCLILIHDKHKLQLTYNNIVDQQWSSFHYGTPRHLLSENTKHTQSEI